MQERRNFKRHLNSLKMRKTLLVLVFALVGFGISAYAQESENPKISKKQLKEQAIKYEKIDKIDSAIIAYEKLLSIDTTLNILNYEIGRLWNKLGGQIIDTTCFDNSIRYFETYLSNFKIKSKQYPKGERDSTEYHKTYQNVLSIKKKNLSLKQQLREIKKYDDLLKAYEGYWVSYFFSAERMVPQWIFHFKRDSINQVLTVELDKASYRFSNESPNQRDFPIILEDEGLAFRLSKQKTFTPSQNAYYMKHLFVDISNPTYVAAIQSSKGKNNGRYLTEDFIDKQKEIDAKLHAQLEEQLKIEIARARIQKTEEEFTVNLISDTVMSVTCREIIANPANKKGSVTIDTINCVFYKIPDDLTFIVLGRSNIRFENKKHSKADLKDIGFTKWNNRSITGNVFGHLAYLTVAGACTFGYGSLWELYRLGVLMLTNYAENIGNENLLRNPRKWNTKMYNILLNHYNPTEKLNLESPVKVEKKESKKEKKKREKEERANINKYSTAIVTPQPVESAILPNIQNDETTQPIISVFSKDNKSNQTIIEIEAIDYVTNIKDLVICFDNKRTTFEHKLKAWENQLIPYIEEIGVNNRAINQTEKELNGTDNKKTRKFLKLKLKNQKKVYTQSIKDFKLQGADIVEQLKTYNKQETESIHQQFKNTNIKIEPTTTFPAMSSVQNNIVFSNRIENLQTLIYLKPIEELLYWYQDVEYSFYKIIEFHNQKAKNTIQIDKELEVKQNFQNKQLIEYQKDKKKYKKEIKKLKKEIFQTEKERKDIANQMIENSKNLSAQLKEYHKEILKTFNTKMKTIIGKIDYNFKKINEKW